MLESDNRHGSVMHFNIQLSAYYLDKSYGGDLVYADMLEQARCADQYGYESVGIHGLFSECLLDLRHHRNGALVIPGKLPLPGIDRRIRWRLQSAPEPIHTRSTARFASAHPARSQALADDRSQRPGIAAFKGIFARGKTGLKVVNIVIIGWESFPRKPARPGRIMYKASAN